MRSKADMSLLNLPHLIYLVRKTLTVTGRQMSALLVVCGGGLLILEVGEKPVTGRTDDLSSTRQHTVMGHATDKEEEGAGIQGANVRAPSTICSAERPSLVQSVSLGTC